MQAGARRIGILAGGGSLPREIAESAVARGNAVHIVAIDGEADADFGSFAVSRVNWGQLGGLLKALKGARAEDLVIVGRVRRPDPLRLKTDLGFFLNLPAIARIVASGGDDSVLRKVVRFFEEQGLRVVSPADAAPELVVGAGPLAAAVPSSEDAADIARGFALVRALGRYDIGQSVIVSGGSIEAIEGAEGTDAMLVRVGRARRGQDGTRRGILVKRTKPGQDLRVDMPAIGPETVARIMETGLKGAAVEAGRVLVARRSETIARADAGGVFVAGCEDSGRNEAGAETAFGTVSARSFAALGRVVAGSRHQPDVETGAAVLASSGAVRRGSRRDRRARPCACGRGGRRRCGNRRACLAAQAMGQSSATAPGCARRSGCGRPFGRCHARAGGGALRRRGSALVRQQGAKSRGGDCGCR